MKKVLWIMSRPLSGSFGSSNNNFSGTWLDAAFDGCSNQPDVELHIATVGKVNKVTVENRGRHTLYLLPGGDKYYDENNSTNVNSWGELKKLCNPDILQIWGTECDYAKLALQTFSDIPSIIYIQGIMAAVARGYDAGLSLKTKLQIITPYDLIHRNWINKNQNKYYKRAEREKKVLNMATAAIVENDWCEDQIHSIAPNCICYRSHLPIKQSFWTRKWSINNIERHTVFTNAGSMPLKGHHILLEALRIIVAKYPKTKLYIPGTPLAYNNARRNLNTSGYSLLLSRQIVKYNLQNNIEYVGLLSDVEMTEYLSKVNVYVMPSCVENHSSSLIEAQIVGTPCVSSFVGGIGSFVKNGVNAMLYNFPDSASLAGNVCRIFESDDLAKSLSNESRKMMEKRPVDVGLELLDIYNTM